MRGAWVRGVRMSVSAAVLAGLAHAAMAPAMPPGDAPISRPGAALRRAVEARDAGDAQRAESLLAEIRTRFPDVADFADLLHLRLLVDAERFEEAIGLVGEDAHRGSSVRVELLELLGRAHAGRGDEVSARSMWERATRATGSRERLASLHLRIAESFGRSGRLDRAAQAYRRIWVRYPDLAEGAAADRALDALEREIGSVFRDAAHTLERGDVLLQHNHNEGALAAYEEAIVLGLPADDRRRAEAGRADTLFRLRRYPEAALAYRALPATETSRIEEARAHARSGQVPRAARELAGIGEGSRSSEGVRALLIAALLWDGEGAWDQAEPLYRAVCERAPGTPSAAEARWQLGWRAFKGDRHAEAIRHFEILHELEAKTDPIAALRPLYWILRAREQAGEPEAAAGYAALAREYPLTYYGWRAAARAPRAFDALPREPQPLAAGTEGLQPEDLPRVRILLEAGLDDVARDELALLDTRARGLADRLGLAQLHAERGAFDRAQRLVVDGYGESLSRGPVPGQLEVWWHAWPAPFEDDVRAVEAQDGHLDAGLLYSIMREESGYRPGVISVAGARGLLQLMPATAERVARDVQLVPFTPDDLFLPSVNIRLGSAYLEGLLREFEGRRSAAIGSYNAGPHVVARWVQRGAGEDDVFVEEIPYTQTRGYVKRVMRSLHAYRVLY
jgi:soluble lytic murein transglycosylase